MTPFVLALLVAACLGKLPGFHVNTSSLTVSGISAGAFMATQLGTAFSSKFIGVGAIAGGPYYCARGAESTALTACMAVPELINVNTLVQDTRNFAQQGQIDDVKNIARQKIYLYSGILDEVVHRKVVQSAGAYYSALGVNNMMTEYSILSSHCHPTDAFGNICAFFGTPYINKCNYDASGIILNYFLGKLAAPGTFNSSNVLSFDQSDYVSSGNGFARTGYAYVPSGCRAGALCSLHVAFHGCSMSYGNIQGAYVQNAGYNTWAESNNIIVLYPQADSSANNACFDWWGYTNSNYASKNAVQMAGVMEMIRDLSSPTTAGK